MKFNYKKNIALVLSLIMTAYSAEVPALISEKSTVNAVETKESPAEKKTEPAVETAETAEPEVKEETADIYVENVTCAGGDIVKVSVGLVDWTQDIDTAEINLEFDSGLILETAEGLGSLTASVKDNTVTVSGKTDKKDAYRGRIAVLSFRVPEVDVLSMYKVSVASAVLKNSAGKEYKSNYSYGLITADSALKPTGLAFSEINSASVKFCWNMRKNTDKISGYIVYRNGEEIARTEDEEYFDKGLETGAEYTYSVQAYGEDNYISPVSAEIKAVPEASEVTGITFTKTAGYIGGDSAPFRVTLSKDTHVKSVNVFCIDESGNETLICSDEEDIFALRDYIWDLTAAQTGKYSIRVKITDIDGAEISAVSDEITVDKGAPDPVEQFSAFSDEECVRLAWGRGNQLNISGYNIYRKTEDGEYELIKYAEGIDTLSYTDTAAEIGTVYYYNITAVNAFGQEGEMTEAVSASAKADQTPPVITAFMPERGKVLSGTVKISASASDGEGTGVAKVLFSISEDDGTTWTEAYSAEGDKAEWEFDTSVYSYQTVMIKASAEDRNGNTSKEVINKYTVDNKAPEKVTGLELVEAYDTYATVSWKDVPDNDRKYFIAEYTNQITGEKKTQIVRSELGAHFNNLTPSTQYNVVVYAVDGNENISEASDVLEFVTESDSHAPHIVSVNPVPGSFRDSIPLKVTANDNIGIKKITVEVSTDGENFTETAAIENKNTGTSFTAEHTIDLAEYEDGMLYVRFTAYDTDDMTDVITSEYLVDRVSPEKVSNVICNTNENQIEISWDDYEEDRISCYKIFRKTEESEEFELIRVIDSNHRVSNYFDRNIEPGKTYIYAVSATDEAGNESELSDPCSGTVESDSTPPEMYSIYPDSGLSLNSKNNYVRAAAHDNICLKKITVEYYCGTEESEYKVLAEKETAVYDDYIQAVIPEEELFTGNIIHIRAYSEDNAGNKSKYITAEYTVDNTVTTVTNCVANSDNGTVTVSWEAEEADTTVGYEVYKKVGDGDYRYVGRVNYDPSRGGKYTYTETEVEEAGSSWYRIIAYNNNFNKTVFDCKDAVEVYLTPDASLGCEDAMERNKEYIFDGTGSSDVYGISRIEIDYGDGTTDTCTSVADAVFRHRYSYNGVYTVRLTAYNTLGLSSAAVRTVEVTEGKMIGTVNITVKTTEGKPASNIAVYCDVGTSYQTKRYTDANGKISFQTAAGIHSIGVYGDGYLPDIRSCSVMSGADNNYTFSVVEEDIITAKFDVQRMTLDEIKAVGIDVTDKENQHVLKLDVRLTYGAKSDPVNLGGYMYGGGGWGLGVFMWAGEAPNWKVKGNGGEERKLQPVSVSLNSKGEVEQVIILDLPVEASYLKEFFDVKLHIINNASSEFSVVNNVVTLNVPDGLKLIETSGYNKAETVIDEIKGGTQETVQWIIRGDETGKYKLSADYQGLLERFNEDLNYSFESDEITVYGEKAAKVEIFAEDKIEENEMYVKVALNNTSPVDIYNAGALIHDATAETFGEMNDKFQCDFVLSEITSPSGVTEYSLDESVDVLPSGYVFSVIYHLTYISEDMYHPVSHKMINFYEHVAYLIDKKLTNLNNSNIEYELFIEDTVHNQYNHSNDVKNFGALTGANAGMLAMLTEESNIAAAKIADEIRVFEPVLDHAEGKDDVLDFLLNAEFDDLKNTDKVSYINEVIQSLLISEEVEQEIAETFVNQFVDKITKKLDKAISTAKIPGSIKENLEHIDAIKEVLIGDKTKVKRAISELSTGGVSGFISYAGSELSANIRGFDIDDAFLSSLESTIKLDFFSAVDFISDVTGSFEEQWKQYITTCMYRAVYDETVTLLETLSVPCNTDNLSLMVGIQARLLLAKVQGNAFTDASFAVLGIYLSAGESLLSSFCSGMLESAAEGIGGPLGAAIYNLAGWAYGTVQEAIDNKYLYPAKIVIIDSMCDSISRDLKTFIGNSDYKKAMKYVEYLTKLRARESSDCKSFKYSFINGKLNPEYISTPGIRVLYELMVGNTDTEAISDYIAQIQRNSDVLFRPETEEPIHEWPEFEYDYKTQKLTSKLDTANFSYEYRIDENPWVPYTEKLDINTDDKSHLLQIRCTDAAKNAVKTIRINAGEYLEGDLSARYADHTYVIDSSLKGSNMKIVFSDKKELDESDWNTASSWSGGSVKNYRECKYIHIREDATEDKPHSLTRTVAVVSTVSVDAGSTTGGSVSGAGEYRIGDMVTVSASSAKGYVFAGWYIGNDIVSQNPEYSFRAYSDTSLQARFLSKSDYTVTLSSNVESAVNQSVSIDGSGMIYMITSQCSDENYRFSYWEDENGDIVSFLQSFPFVVEGEIALRAVYEKIAG